MTAGDQPGAAAPGSVPTLVLGGAGYVAGELLRLVAGHPDLHLSAVLSASHAGQPVGRAFPHLAPVVGELAFTDRRDDEALAAWFRARGAEHDGPLALFSAAPHGASAEQIDRLLNAAEAAGAQVRLVDLSADFRYDDQALYEEIYGQPHGAPERLGQFACAVPEHLPELPEGVRHVGHPGCFTTAVTLASVGLLASELIEPRLWVSAVTGSTGSGRSPGPGTHHPERQSNLWAYKPLCHRHAPEMRRLAGRATGTTPDVAFVPHSGPFARGIHATLHARLVEPLPAAEVAARIARVYEDAPFVEVVEGPPRIKEVAGSNRCRIAVATDGDRGVVAFSVIDNLLKGAAGGAVQWMNRLLGLDETRGLITPALAWL